MGVFGRHFGEENCRKIEKEDSPSRMFAERSSNALIHVYNVEKNARNLLKLCGDIIIEKTRWLYEFEGFLWEIDEFHGKNEGLWLAEIELATSNESFSKPGWVLEEVSEDERYFNANLSIKPFCEW